MAGNLVPRTDGGSDLGTPQKEYGAIYAKRLGGTLGASLAPKNSPALTGTPTAPTAAEGTSTTQIATTAFAANAASTAGTAAATSAVSTHNSDSNAHKPLFDAIKNQIPSIFASTPKYYSEDVPFHTDTTDNNTTISSPNRLFLNINDIGYSIAEKVDLDISEDSSWDTQAEEWQADTEYALNQVVYPASGKNGYYYKCTTPGTSSTLTPEWPTNVGDTYQDGNVVWECILDYTQAINRPGQDFYIYAGIKNETLGFYVSTNSTVPFGFTADTSRKVGGFHCLCADVGTIEGHKLTGYLAGEVLPASVWDLVHRPKSDPEGMVYVDGLDMWFDIYLNSWTGSTATKTLKAISKYGAVTGDGASTEKFHPLKWEQTLGEQKKRLPWVREFRVFSVGSNQSTNIAGSTDANTAGGHSDTAGRRMISDYGIEDCCGFLWQWCADIGSASTSGSYGNGFDANDRADVKGQIYGAEYRPLVGGRWSNGAVCGSRAADWHYSSLDLHAAYGARGASEPVGRSA